MAVNAESPSAFDIHIVLITPYKELVSWEIKGPTDKKAIVLCGGLPPSRISSSDNCL